MRIYIPTYGRPEKQITYKALPPDLQKLVWFVIRPEEKPAMLSWTKRLLVCKDKGVARARQAAVEHAAQQHGLDRCIFLDDDLRFSRRVNDWEFKSNARALKATPDDIAHGLRWMWDKLDTNADGWVKYAATGLAGRGGNCGIRRREENPNYRIMRSFAVRFDAMEELGIRFDDFFYWEDFHIALSLLEHGYPNLVNVDVITDGVTNTAGGVVRNVKAMWGQARRFVKLHPFAEIKVKEFKWGEKYLKAPDLTVAWKKAFESKRLEGTAE